MEESESVCIGNGFSRADKEGLNLNANRDSALWSGSRECSSSVLGRDWERD
jgi:hypothetical protein